MLRIGKKRRGRAAATRIAEYIGARPVYAPNESGPR